MQAMQKICFCFGLKLHAQPCGSKLQKLSSSGNYLPSFPLPRPNLRRTYQEMEAGTGVISGGLGQEDWGE